MPLPDDKIRAGTALVHHLEKYGPILPLLDLPLMAQLVRITGFKADPAYGLVVQMMTLGVISLNRDGDGAICGVRLTSNYKEHWNMSSESIKLSQARIDLINVITTDGAKLANGDYELRPSDGSSPVQHLQRKLGKNHSAVSMLISGMVGDQQLERDKDKSSQKLNALIVPATVVEAAKSGPSRRSPSQSKSAGKKSSGAKSSGRRKPRARSAAKSTAQSQPPDSPPAAAEVSAMPTAEQVANSLLEKVLKIAREGGANDAAVTALEDRVAELETSLSTVETERDEAQSKLTDAQGKMDEYNALGAEKNDRIRELNTQLADAGQRAADLERQRDETHETAQKLSDELASTKEELEQTKRERDDARREVERLGDISPEDRVAVAREAAALAAAATT